MFFRRIIYNFTCITGGLFMNIAFFLLPKSEVIYLNDKSTLRQAIERMEYHNYSAVPVVSDGGIYVDTLTEGDILWYMKNTKGLTFDTASQFFIRDIPRQREMKSVNMISVFSEKSATTPVTCV